MTSAPNPHMDSSESGTYKIRIKGHLDERWSEWFDHMTITYEESGETLLTGLVIDQAELHGLLKKIRDLGLTLVSVCPDSSQIKN